jgi:hypothetical protein
MLRTMLATEQSKLRSSSAPAAVMQEYKTRCIRAFREACSVANKSLEIFDSKCNTYWFLFQVIDEIYFYFENCYAVNAQRFG